MSADGGNWRHSILSRPALRADGGCLLWPGGRRHGAAAGSGPSDALRQSAPALRPAGLDDKQLTACESVRCWPPRRSRAHSPVGPDYTAVATENANFLYTQLRDVGRLPAALLE